MFKTFTTVSGAWEAMLADCREATSRIYFEQYLFDSFEEGSIGRRFVDVFIEKAQEGVDVRILLDAVGSFSLFTSPLVAKMREAGVQIEFFGVIPAWRRSRRVLFGFIHRDHRKLLVVDDRVAYVGGVVMKDEMASWWDYHARFEDESDACAKVFEDTWVGIQSGTMPTTERVACSSQETLLVVNSPKRRCLYEDMFEHITHAHKQVLIINPYFSPNPLMLRALYDAARRGVSVSLVLPEKTDNVLADMASHSHVTHLLRKGIRVHFCNSRINHAKMMIVDNWATFGSCNFDRLSFLYNYELNVTTDRHEYVTHIMNDAREFMKSSREVERGEWRRRGMRERIAHYIGYLLRPFV